MVEPFGAYCGENARQYKHRGYSPSPRPAAGYLRGAERDVAVQWVNLSGGIVVRMRGGTGLGGIPHPLRPRRVTFAMRNWMLRCNGWTFQGGIVVKMRGGAMGVLEGWMGARAGRRDKEAGAGNGSTGFYRAEI